MPHQKIRESQEAMIARIDERVEHIHRTLPVISKTLNRHDREILVAKVLLGIAAAGLAWKYPLIAEALAKVFSA